MKEKPIVRISSNINAVVVQLPERAKPGVVIQGDSLQNILSLLEEAKHQLGNGDHSECMAVLAEATQLVDGYSSCLPKN